MGECLNRHYARTKFRPNPRGQVFFYVDLTWNDPTVLLYMYHAKSVWLVFEDSIPTCACFHLENFFVTCYIYVSCKVCISAHSIFIITDECQNKYGNANAWRYCCRVFDLLTVAAVSC